MERYDTLATIELIKLLQEDGVPFSVRYELVSDPSNGKPEYECLYNIPTTERFGRLGKSLLVPAKIPAIGSPARRFNLWPGLLRHHQEFGDGTWLCIHPTTYEVKCVKEPPES